MPNVTIQYTATPVSGGGIMDNPESQKKKIVLFATPVDDNSAER